MTLIGLGGGVIKAVAAASTVARTRKRMVNGKRTMSLTDRNSGNQGQYWHDVNVGNYHLRPRNY